MNFVIKFLIFTFGLLIGALGYLAVMLGASKATDWEGNILFLFAFAALIFTSKSLLNLYEYRESPNSSVMTLLKIAIFLDVLFLLVVFFSELLGWKKIHAHTLDFYILITYLSVWQIATLLTVFLQRKS